MEPAATYGSSGAVLVLDDEAEVRKLVNALLTAAGYPVFVADSGEHALQVFAKHSSEITLLLTDVVAPGMSGPLLAERMIELQPHLKVIFMSGYAASSVVRRYVVERGSIFISKPFNTQELVQTVEAAIGPAQRSMHGR
jgi:two-component system cell cycle sensor histidine kinase/response regulator CckA